MSRLIDHLLRAKPEPAIYAALKACTVIAADNVAAYLEGTGQFGEWQTATELPYVVPPLKDMLVEHRLGKPVGSHGWYLHTYERDESGYLPSTSPYASDPDVRWMVRGFYYMDYLPQKPHLWCEFFIDARGQLHKADNGEAAIFVKPTHDSRFLSLYENDPNGRKMGWIGSTLIVTLWTLCFMHTRNVTIDTVEPPEKLNKAHQKRGHEPLSVYKVLRITPMGSARGEAGGGEHASPSMHIRRGHFKHYNEGNGLLFGKYEGVYWWEQRLIGRRERGQVRKDYEVKV